ncbi:MULTISPECIES: site-specific integrase [unclassified Pseudomonas]|uniref:site-specific integrase n=1 Tax=unclassified Pseudomonas TaxID=196821 RepID=UPI0039B772CE
MKLGLAEDYKPGEFYSKDGYLVVFDTPRWKLNRDIDIPVSTLTSALGTELYTSFQRVLAFYAQSHAPSHVKNLYERCRHYLLNTSGQPPFSVESMISYRSQLDRQTDWYLGTLRGMIRKWADLGYTGIPAETLALLAKWRIKGNEKGYAVQSMCPDSGPLTDIEMETVIGGVLTGYAEGRLTLSDTCYAMILAMTGRRPSQITSLRIKDILIVQDKYFINFPRGKQRGTSFRSVFKRFPIVEDLWMLLQQQSAAVIKFFAGVIGADVPVSSIPELPLFPAVDQFDPATNLESQLDGDILHAASSSVLDAMVRLETNIKMISERTGLRIHLNPTRFRYTLGTNLAREGKGEYVVAEGLDHSDNQNAGVYVRNVPEIVERLDKALALQLAPIAQAFQGVLVVSEKTARRGGEPESRIRSGGGNVGNCGSYGFCGALAPVACYTCTHFQPWLDGPHEYVLDQLISERDDVYEDTGDLKIASVNDRLILAVSDVVARCKAKKSEITDV